MNDCISAWINGRINEWMNEWMSEWVNEWMNEWMHEWMNARMHVWNRTPVTVSWAFTRPHLPKVLRLWHFFQGFVSQIELSLLSRAPFADLIFQKCSESFTFLTVQIELSLKSCALFVDNLPIEERTCGNRDPTSATTAATITRKGFAPEGVFKPEFTRSQSLALPNYLMMLWLQWWHDDVTDVAVPLRPARTELHNTIASQHLT